MELDLREHDKSDASENKGVFRELIQFSEEPDKELQVHLSTLSVFKGISKTIQNELLQCILEVYHEEVRKEIERTDYVAIVADETNDVFCDFQLIIVLLYIVNGKPVERFWNFVNPDGQNNHAISEIILKETESLIGDDPTKLIA